MEWSLFYVHPYFKTDTRFRVLYFKMNNFQNILMLHQQKELLNNSEKTLSYYNFTDENGYMTIRNYLCIYINYLYHFTFWQLLIDNRPF